MATRGRLEAQITVPSGGWDVELDDSSSATATVAAGTYYLTSLASTLKTALDSASAAGETYTVSIDHGEGGGGKVTISNTGTNFSLTWTDTDLRDALGFTGTVSGDSSHTGSNHARMLWLPDVVKITPYGDQDDGTEMTNARATQNSSTVKVIYGKRWQEMSGLRWRGVSHARCRIAGESTTNESFEKFWRDGILGEGPGGTAGGPLRLYWDADTDGTYTKYMVAGQMLRTFAPEQFFQNATIAWTIEFDKLVKQ